MVYFAQPYGVTQVHSGLFEEAWAYATCATKRFLSFLALSAGVQHKLREHSVDFRAMIFDS